MSLAAAGLAAIAAQGAGAGEPALRDPTVVPGLQAAGGAAIGQPLRLRSTHVSAKVQSAVINDHIVTPGSRIAGATVISIEPGSVQLRRGRELITLRMLLPPVKRPAQGDDT